VEQEHAINGEMQQTNHIIKCDCHLPKFVVQWVLVGSINTTT